MKHLSLGGIDVCRVGIGTVAVFGYYLDTYSSGPEQMRTACRRALYNDVNLTFCVPRSSSGQNPNQPVVVRTPKPKDLPSNHVLIKVDRFGFSTNK